MPQGLHVKCSQNFKNVFKIAELRDGPECSGNIHFGKIVGTV